MLVGNIAKFETQDDGSLIIEGIASTPAVDHDGEVIDPEALKKALPHYLQKGSVREMHVLAAGKPLNAFVSEEGHLHLKAKIIDTSTIAKIKEGILKEFSVGGKTLAKVGNKITSLILKEISVVDHGCNPNTFFTICKVEETAQKPQQTMTKEDLLKMLADPDVVAVLKGAAPQPAPLNTQDLTKSLGIEELQKSLNTIKADADAAKALAVTAERNAIIAEASRDGKEIPLSADDIAKMDVTLLKNLVSKLPKAVIPTKRTEVKKFDKPEDKEAYLAEKRSEAADNFTKYFKAQGFATA